MAIDPSMPSQGPGMDPAPDPGSGGGAQQGAPIPQGATIGQPPPPQGQSGSAIPAGATIGGAPPTAQSSPAQSGQHFASANPNDASDYFHHEPGEGAFMGSLRNAGGALEGIGEGASSTLASAAHLINNMTGGVIPKSVTDKLDAAAGNGSGGRSDAAHGFGFGGESLGEFLMGDEALKGLSLADRLAKSSAIVKALENSPRLMTMLRLGANVGKAGLELGPEERALLQKYPVISRLVGAGMDAVRAGAIQGAQTTAKTGADGGTLGQSLGEGAKDAAKMAGTAGLIGGATAAAGGVLTQLGNTASKTRVLAQAAGDATDKAGVAGSIAQRINDAEKELHTTYQASLDDFTKRLSDQQTPYEGSPLHKAAQSISATAADETKPLDKAFNQVRPGSKGVNKMVDLLADPNPEAEAPKADTWTDADGKTHVEPSATVTPPEPIQIGMPELIERRQQLGEQMRNTDTMTSEGRADRAAYRTLMGGIDDTIGKLAAQSGDPSVVNEYAALRDNYRSKINLFDDPLIEKLKEGKVDDAAKGFVGSINQNSALPSAGKVRYNTDTLRQIIGDQGVKDFGKQVFGTMLRDSIEGEGVHARFNPAKFTQTWNRINQETKGDLFDLDPSGGNKTPVMPKGSAPGSMAQAQQMAQNGQARVFDISELAKDAKAAANLQHLTRAGLLVPTLGALGATHGIVGIGLGSALGLTLAEGGGIAKGRELLNYVANHPRVWGMYEGAAAKANSTVARGVAKVAATGAGKGVVDLTAPPPRQNSRDRVFGSVGNVLGNQ